MHVHATAVVHRASRVSPDVVVGAYAVVEDGVEIGDRSVVREHAILRCGCRVGNGCQIDAHAVIGGLPQDLSFNPNTASGVHLADGVAVREGVTINRATREGTQTEVGEGCYLMANSHVGHDCRLGANVILANGVLLGGHVQIGDFAFLGGNTAVHQFVRIGEGAMIGGLSRISMDVPPFCMVAERNHLVGLNLIGLRRRGYGREDVRDLKWLFQQVFSGRTGPAKIARELLDAGSAQTGPGAQFLEFLVAPSRKGIVIPTRRKSGAVADANGGE